MLTFVTMATPALRTSTGPTQDDSAEALQVAPPRVADNEARAVPPTAQPSFVDTLTALLTPHPDAAYRAEQARADVVRARVIGGYCAVVYPIFGVLDYIVYPQHIGSFLVARGLIAVLALLLLWTSWRSPRAGVLARAVGIAATLGVAWMCVHSEGFRSNYVIGVIICFLALTTVELFRPRAVLVTLLGIFVSYVGANLVVHPDSTLPDAIAAGFFLFGSVIFCVIASLLLEHSRRRLHQAQTELLQRNHALERAQREQRELLRTITHELRTPITSVLGFIELIEMQDAGLQPQTRERLARMTAASSRLAAMVNDILDHSRIEAGKVLLAIEQLSLHALLEDVAADTQALLKARDVRVDVRCDVGIAWCCDRMRLRQVLTNLAGNAVKFTPEGVIELKAAIDASQHLCIWVIDSGIGIRAEDQPLLLEPFAQTEQGRVAGGTGLGLSISKRLVELMGGTLTFTSELGRGTAFQVRIPPLQASAP
jgi:signal transduction histidine kinase